MKKISILSAILAIAATVSCTKPLEDLNPTVQDSKVTIESGHTVSVVFTLNDVRGNNITTKADFSASEKYEVTTQFTQDDQQAGLINIKAPEKILDTAPFDVTVTFSDGANGRKSVVVLHVTPVLAPLEELNPVFTPDKVSINSGEQLKVPFTLNDVRGNEITYAVDFSESEEWYVYSATCEFSKDYASGTLVINAPDAILNGKAFDLKITFTDETNSRTAVGKVNVTPVVSEKYVEFTEHSNSFIATSGAIAKFPLFKGNSDEKADIDELVLGWQDNQGALSSVRAVSSIDGYAIVLFNEGKEGNVVLNGVKDSKVVWSWHFWLTDDAPKDVTIGGYTFLDRNIGAVSLDEKSELSSGVIYQYGRKDPFPGIKFSAYELRDAYDKDGNAVTFAIKQNEEVDNIANSIENPTTYYNNRYKSGQKHNYSWVTTDFSAFGTEKFKALWDNDGKKTQYDPCPAGYKVAPVAAWTEVKTVATEIQEIWDDAYETFDQSAIGTNAKYIPGNKKKVQFRGCIYNGLRFTVNGEVSSNSDTFGFANCVGKALPTAVVWCSNIDPDFAAKQNVSYFRGTAAKVNTSGNGNYDDVSAIKVNALSSSGKYGLNYALPVRCVREN